MQVSVTYLDHCKDTRTCLSPIARSSPPIRGVGRAESMDVNRQVKNGFPL